MRRGMSMRLSQILPSNSGQQALRAQQKNYCQAVNELNMKICPDREDRRQNPELAAAAAPSHSINDQKFNGEKKYDVISQGRGVISDFIDASAAPANATSAKIGKPDRRIN